MTLNTAVVVDKSVVHVDAPASPSSKTVLDKTTSSPAIQRTSNSASLEKKDESRLTKRYNQYSIKVAYEKGSEKRHFQLCNLGKGVQKLTTTLHKRNPCSEHTLPQGEDMAVRAYLYKPWAYDACCTFLGNIKNVTEHPAGELQKYFVLTMKNQEFIQNPDCFQVTLNICFLYRACDKQLRVRAVTVDMDLDLDGGDIDFLDSSHGEGSDDDENEKEKENDDDTEQEDQDNSEDSSAREEDSDASGCEESEIDEDPIEKDQADETTKEPSGVQGPLTSTDFGRAFNPAKQLEETIKSLEERFQSQEKELDEQVMCRDKISEADFLATQRSILSRQQTKKSAKSVSLNSSPHRNCVSEREKILFLSCLEAKNTVIEKHNTLTVPGQEVKLSEKDDDSVIADHGDDNDDNDVIQFFEGSFARFPNYLSALKRKRDQLEKNKEMECSKMAMERKYHDEKLANRKRKRDMCLLQQEQKKADLDKESKNLDEKIAFAETVLKMKQQ